MATRTSKLAAAWTISRFIPKWRTLVTILFFFASFCVGGVCGILAERKEAARLQALFFDKQKKLSQNVPNRTGESELNPDVSHEDEEQRDEAEQWQDVNGVETEETSKSSFAEFNVGWSRHTREKRVNKMLQEAHVVFISRGLEELRSIFEAFSPDPGSAVVAEAAGAFTGPLPLPSSNASGVPVALVARGLVALDIPQLDAGDARAIAESMDRDRDGLIRLSDWVSRFGEADRALRLEYLTWVRDILLQSFPSVAGAFQAFDNDGDKVVSALDFAVGLDSLVEISEDDTGKVLWSLGVKGGMEGGFLYYGDFLETFRSHGLRV